MAGKKNHKPYSNAIDWDGIAQRLSFSSSKEMLRNLYLQANWSLEEIAAYLRKFHPSLHWTSVRNFIKQQGIEIRPRGGRYDERRKRTNTK